MQSGIKKSILIVDDDKDILTFLSYNLRKEGYRIFTATDGEEAFAQVKKDSTITHFIGCNDACP